MNIEAQEIKQTTTEEKLAQFISWIFHPLLMPTYGFLILFFTPNYISVFTPVSVRLAILIVTSAFTLVLPSISVLILLKTGKIKNLQLEQASDRIMPYGGTILYYFALYYLFHSIAISPLFKALILGASLSVLITFLINFKWKISAHTVGIGGITGALLATIYRLHAEFYLMLMLIVFIAGIIGYARLKLKAHTPTQVYSGFLVGFLVQFWMVLIY